MPSAEWWPDLHSVVPVGPFLPPSSALPPMPSAGWWPDLHSVAPPVPFLPPFRALPPWQCGEWWQHLRPVVPVGPSLQPSSAGPPERAGSPERCPRWRKNPHSAPQFVAYLSPAEPGISARYAGPWRAPPAFAQSGRVRPRCSGGYPSFTTEYHQLSRERPNQHQPLTKRCSESDHLYFWLG